MKRRTVTVGATLLAALWGCASPEPDNLRETWLDPDYRSVPVIDIAVLKPQVASPAAEPLAFEMRQAARAYLLESKAYSTLADQRVDADAAAAAVDAASDGPTAARAFESADAVCLIRVTEWDRDWLTPRGVVYATGEVAIYARRDGRRLYESTFKRERLMGPGSVSDLNVGEAERAMARELMKLSLAGFPRKITR
ncbi:MAG TPA: hypothetical protein VEI02_17185 [Planctomycetota bacterium]|nr:hypothetical protein [Planctomycetota bacterium]